jgi:hypothetical protein
MEVCCVLCGTPGASEVTTDHGNRHNISCPSIRCGRYVITGAAIRRLETGGPQKSVLLEMVRRANMHSKVLEIFVAGDGLLQAVELPGA